jgi:hypothetical protein
LHECRGSEAPLAAGIAEEFGTDRLGRGEDETLRDATTPYVDQFLHVVVGAGE